MRRNHVGVLITLVVLMVCSGCAVPQIAKSELPQSPVTVTLSATHISTVTPTVVPSQTPSPIPTKTPTPKPSASPTTIPTPTYTPTPLPAPVDIERPSLDKLAIHRIVRVPIVMYHYVSTPPMDADKYRLDLSLKPRDFEVQLQYLAKNGYQTISLYDLYRALAVSDTLPAKPIILTFDDGYRDAYINVFPLLKKYGMTGTFFVISDFINDQNPAYLTWAMVKEMSDSGMSIESHSRTHPDMRGRSNAFLVWQILGPIEAITAYTGKRPHFFCYPSGKFDDAVVRVLRSVDTWAALTTSPGNVHTLWDSMEWSRVRIHGTTTVRDFAYLIR